MLEDEGFQYAFSDSGLYVDAGEEVSDEVEVLFVGGYAKLKKVIGRRLVNSKLAEGILSEYEPIYTN
jgi:hypothetical protein